MEQTLRAPHFVHELMGTLLRVLSQIIHKNIAEGDDPGGIGDIDTLDALDDIGGPGGRGDIEDMI